MKNLLTILICSVMILFLTGCGGLNKEINRLTEESKSKTLQYEKRISELNTKISETEKRETLTKTDLAIKNSEIATLKRELTQVKQELEKKESSNFGVENPKGPIKVTDAKGNKYEFEGGEGTRISNSSESTLSAKLNSVTESLSNQIEKSKDLSKTVASQETAIKQKDTQISEQKEEITKLNSKIKTLHESLAKSVLKKGTAWYIWVIIGMFVLGVIQLLWKLYKHQKKILP